MAAIGSIFADINPNATSGTQLATLLNNFKDIVRSGLKTEDGNRPTNLYAGGFWVDAQNDPIVYLKQFDGSVDITILTIDWGTSSVSFGSSASPFAVLKQSDDSVGPILKLSKERIAGGKQVLTGDTVGSIDLTGTTDAGVEEILCQILSIAQDDITSSAQGCKLSFFTTAIGTAALTERLTILDNGMVGIGETNPLNRLHVKGNSTYGHIKNEIVEDSTVGPILIQKKKRSTGNGQVLNNDIIGQTDFYAADENGAEVLMARLQIKANEDSQSTQHGSDLILSTVKKGETALSEMVRIQDGKIIPSGDNFSHSNASLGVPDTPVSILSIDGAIYGSFEMTIFAHGRDDTVEYRSQKTTIFGVYNYTTSLWDISEDISTLTDTSDLLTFTPTNGQTLGISYNNQFVLANFVDGEIQIETKKFLRA